MCLANFYEIGQRTDGLDCGGKQFDCGGKQGGMLGHFRFVTPCSDN